MIYQLHWQNVRNPKETSFVAQASTDYFPAADVLLEHFYSIIDRRRAECPDGWGPLICTEDSEYFVFAAPPV